MTLELSSFKGYKSILCLNGELPEARFFKATNLPVVAADGAANSLHVLGIKPHIIIGDLDSVLPSLLQDTAFIHLPEQNSNDYQKTMAYLHENNLLPSIIVGINGGYLDHVLNNINIFMGGNCLLYAPPLKGFVLNEKKRISLSLTEHTKISLLGIPAAIVSSKGLKWELNNSPLTFPGNNSCYNRTVSEQVEIKNHQGEVLVLIYEGTITDAGGKA
ncbi:thiamine diphosphokinase [Legionella shakespearei]|uniref:Thiamine diphosphokinase n=1 Tax=Legionella shakespearei DSM 23087 TaxID=1122169 RepID=A0A0W0YQC8_9GAMM|nr:thiamine diphosphokinase [Legionella shakespearei]KTD59082.1 thiamine pyrophosphokinase [Legionella shakespearei DSM 23087]